MSAEMMIHLEARSLLSGDVPPLDLLADLDGAGSVATDVVVTMTEDNVPIAFERYRGEWRHTLLTAAAGYPHQADWLDVEIWASPRDGLHHAVASMASGVVLFTRSANGTWSWRDLVSDVSDAESIASSLTVFVDNRGLAHIAGLNARQELVLFSETGLANIVIPPDPGFTPPPIPWEMHPVREIPNYYINDIAITTVDYWGPVIYYNPLVVQQAGELVWTFFRAHEYGHALLGIGTGVANESLADRYATDVLSLRRPEVIQAAADYFRLNIGWLTDGLHATGIERAASILERASWIAGLVADAQDEPTVVVRDWSFQNITVEHLRPQGFETPRFTGRLESFVTSWNAMNIAGLDAAGQIQAVWIAPGMQRWRTANLSEQTGAPRLTGGLTAYLTPWGGINLAGTDDSGSVLVTWWVPSFGAAWHVSNLTELLSAPPMRSATLCSFVTPWGALNLVGVSDDGTLGALWWAPGMSTWAFTDMNTFLPSDVGPLSRTTAYASPNGKLSVLAGSGQSELTHLYWAPGMGSGWLSEELTAVI